MSDERLVLLGVNHKTAPVQLREQLTLTEGYEGPLRSLQNLGLCRELFLLSTCNRFELLFVTGSGEEGEQQVLAHLFGAARAEKSLEDAVYLYREEEAVRHLFTVAASLDSMVVGEAQILGQIKDAYRQAASLGCTGVLLNRLLHKSFSVAKRVRNETGIGSSSVSISSAAVQLARTIFGGLGGKVVLLIGAGEMAELAATHLVGQGVAEVVVANRTLAHAVELARRFDGRAVSLDELTAQLELVDIVISSTGAAGEILTREDVRPLMRKRRNRPLFFIDIAVPHDLDPHLGELDNVFLYDIDDLTHVVAINRSQREQEAAKAVRLVDEEVLKFVHWRDGLALSPTIRALRQKIEGTCHAELERSLVKLSDLTEQDRLQLERMVQAMVARMLHDPLQYLKQTDCPWSKGQRLQNLRTIFRLDDNEDCP